MVEKFASIVIRALCGGLRESSGAGLPEAGPA